MKLYHCPKTRSTRIVWLLGELGDVDCEIVECRFTLPDGHLYRQETPVGKFPTLEDDGVAFFESGAIVEYILTRYGRGRLRPITTSPEFGRYLQWIHFSEATLGIALGTLGWLRGQPRTKEKRAMVMAFRGRAVDSLLRLDAALDGRDWLIGDGLTGADIMCDFSVVMARAFGVDVAQFASIEAWSARISQRPAWQTAMAGDLPY